MPLRRNSPREPHGILRGRSAGCRSDGAPRAPLLPVACPQKYFLASASGGAPAVLHQSPASLLVVVRVSEASARWCEMDSLVGEWLNGYMSYMGYMGYMSYMKWERRPLVLPI